MLERFSHGRTGDEARAANVMGNVRNPHSEAEGMRKFSALHQAALILQDPYRPVDDVVSDLAVILNLAWQYPSQAAVRIRYGDEVYIAGNFRETPWQLTATFDTGEDQTGHIDVVYLTDLPERDEGPFLESERDLLEAVASMLGAYLERRHYERQTHQLARFTSENPNPVLRIDANGQLLYANKGAAPLLEAWSCAPGETVPEPWAGIVARALALDTQLTLDANAGDTIFVCDVTPVAEGGYANLYGRDVTERRRAEMALLQSEERFARAFSSSPAPSAICKANNGPFIHANDSFLRLFGYERREVIGRTDVELGLWADDDARAKAVAGLEEHGAIRDLEVPARHKSGEIRHVIASMEEIDMGGERCVLVLVFDVTERMRREREQRALATLAEALRTARTLDEVEAAIVQQPLDLLQAEAAGLSLLDGEKSEIDVGCTAGPWEAFHGGWPPLDAAEMCGSFCLPLRVEGKMVGALQFVRRAPLGDGDLPLLHTLGDMAAATLDRVALFERLQEYAGRVQQIMESVPDGVVLLNTARRIVLTNPVADRYLPLLSDACTGDQLTTLAGRPLTDFIYGRPGMPPETSSLEITLEEEDLIFFVVARPVASAAEGGGLVVLLRDVTEARQQELYQQAQERLATVGQLAAGIAHDFNNILSVITLYTEALQQRPYLEEADRRRLQTMVEQSQRAVSLIEQLLDYSRRSVLERRPLLLGSFIKEQTRLLRVSLPENISLDLTCDGGDYTVRADATRIQQMVMNLATNARDAMPSGGCLHIVLSLEAVAAEAKPLPDMVPGRWVRLQVSDDGQGIPPDVLPHIFEPFFTTKEPDKGTGLGLSQVYGIVKQHGGFIDVESQTGVGTTFTIYLPLYEPESAAAPAAGETQKSASPANGHQETIMVVEDHEATRQALSDMLELFNYRVLQAADANEALALYEGQAGEIDLVLSDLVLTGRIGGDALYERLAARYEGVKVVLMTGYPLQDRGRALLEAGVLAWLRKPFTVDEVTAVVREALEG